MICRLFHLTLRIQLDQAFHGLLFWIRLAVLFMQMGMLHDNLGHNPMNDRSLMPTAARLLAMTVLTLWGLACAAPSHAQMLGFGGGEADVSTELPDTLTSDEAKDLMSRLSDTAVREILLRELDKRTVDEAGGAVRQAEFLHHATAGAAEQFLTSVTALPRTLEHQVRVLSIMNERLGGFTGVVIFFLKIIALVLAGFWVERAFVRFMRRQGKRKARGQWVQGRPPFKLVMEDFGRDLARLAVFTLFIVVVAQFVFAGDVIHYAGIFFFWMVFGLRIARAIFRLLLAPDRPELRIAYATDETARQFMFHQTMLVFLVSLLVCNSLLTDEAGLDMEHTPFAFWINLSVHIYIIALGWIFRDELTLTMRGRHAGVSRYEAAVAVAYPYFGILVSLVTWWVVNIIASYGNLTLLASAPHYKTMLILLFAPVLDTAIRGAVQRYQPDMRGEGDVAERAYVGAQRSYIRIGRLLVFTLVLLMITGFWDLSLVDLASAGVGVRVAADLVQFFIICAIGYVVYESVSLWINQKLAAEITATGFDPDAAEMGGDGGGVGGSRLSTVLPLLLNVSRVTIAVVFILLALGNAGVNITPLLAGAGILGLAIGFGAQKLVTDVVSGVFFLIDDAFRIAEYVTVEGTMGTVERISIRSLQLRHHKGAVHTIPYGEIPKITNFSRDWVIMKLRFTVPFDSDPNQVKKIFKRIGQELLQDPVLGDDFIQPFKSQGVLEIDDVGMVIRGKFMAKPGKQFMIRKEVYNRVSAAFAENHIPFARREVRVALPEGTSAEELTDDQKRAISAAASAAAPDVDPLDANGQSDER